jgi:small subunit ribosomal protein S11
MQDEIKTIQDEEKTEKTVDINIEENLENAEVATDETDEVANEEKTGEKKVIVKGKKKKKKEPFLRGGRGQVHIKSTYNNTIIAITDLNGALLAWASAGKCGFKGPKKATPYAAGVIVKSLIDKIKLFGIKEVEVFVKGLGMGREAAVRALGTNGVQVISIKDVTPIAHGGVRPKKARRV